MRGISTVDKGYFSFNIRSLLNIRESEEDKKKYEEEKTRREETGIIYCPVASILLQSRTNGVSKFHGFYDYINKKSCCIFLKI